jgi:hypothetical protein
MITFKLEPPKPEKEKVHKNPVWIEVSQQEEDKKPERVCWISIIDYANEETARKLGGQIAKILTDAKIN